MSIMTDARLRLLEARVAEIERRIGERIEGVAEPDAPMSPPMPTSVAANKTSKPSKRNRKTP